MSEEKPTRGVTSRRRSALALLALAVAMVVLAPVALAVVALNALVMIVVGVGRVIAAHRSRARREAAGPPGEPAPRFPDFVSIQVPICNEPPELVKRTLDSLARLDHDAYEVIVLDNNTTDPALWKPVQAHCEALGPRFRFRHEDRVEGFKAGALELCIAMRDPRTEWYLVVDADYVVRPDLLRLAARRLRDEDERIDFVQFPQAYRNEEVCPGLALEYRAFFDGILEAADRAGCALPTGTLCLVRRRSLEAVGGWSARSLTEDAELGATVVGAGGRGAFVNAVTGRGLMPDELEALRKQRRRWVVGNAQTLKGLDVGRVRGLRRRALLMLQLTAWFDFLLAPALVLAALAVFGTRGETAFLVAGWIAAGSVLLETILDVLAFAASARGADLRRRLGLAFEAMLARRALAREASVGWIFGLVGTDLGFERTSKFRGGEARRAWVAPAIVASVLLALVAAALFRERTVVAAGLLALALAPVGTLLLHAIFRARDDAGSRRPVLAALLERLASPFTRPPRRAG